MLRKAAGFLRIRWPESSDYAFLNKFEIQEQARLVYLFAENSPQNLQKIIQRQVLGAHKLGWEITNEQLSNIILQPSRRLLIDDQKSGFMLVQECIKEHAPGIVIFDPISLHVSFDINKLQSVTKLFGILSDLNEKYQCSFILIHHYRKPSKNDSSEPIHQIAGSSGFGNFCESFIGIDRYHGRRSSLYKQLHFTLRQEASPDPMIVYRNPESMLFEVVAKEDAIQRSASVNDIAKILKEEFGGKASYSMITDYVSERFEITKQRVAELLADGRDEGKLSKEAGKSGKWCINDTFASL